MSRVTLRIFGMDCTACAPQIQHILLRQQGVQAAEVNYSAGKATLDADLRVLDWKAIDSAIRRAGFALPVEKTTLRIRRSEVDKAVQRLENWSGVHGVQKEGETLCLMLYPIGLSAQDVQQQLAPIDCEVVGWDTGEEELEQNNQLTMLRQLLVSVALSTPIF